jgi:hypothetical protein
MTILTSRHRALPAGGQWAAGLVWCVWCAACLCGALFAPPPARAATTWRAELTTGAGYDDDVLGRPGEDNSFPILATGYLQLAPSLRGSLASGAWRFSGGWDYVMNAYESSDAGIYHDHRAGLDAAFAPARTVRLRMEGEAEWFRRTEFQDYDFNRVEGAPSVAWLLADDWRLDATWRFGRTTYPERAATPLDPDDQVDEPNEYELALAWQPSDRWYLSFGAAQVEVASNSRQYEYGGTRWTAETWVQAGHGWTVDALLIREHRDYDLFRQPGSPPGREDDSWQLVLDVQRRLSRSARLFATASLLDYGSSLDDYAFDQSRLSAGVTVGLGRAESASTLVATGLAYRGAEVRTDPVAPVIEGGSVTFRCRAAGAREVHLVGSFNDWDPAATAMTATGPGGLWTATLSLAPGLHRYMFLVDGTEWRTPEGAPLYEDDGFGQKNGVIDVPTPVTTGPAGGPTDGSNPR